MKKEESSCNKKGINELLEKIPKAMFIYDLNPKSYDIETEKWLFYENCIIIKKENSINKYFLFDLKIKSFKSSYVLSVGNNTLLIKKEHLDGEFKQYLDSLIENNERNKYSKKDIVLDINNQKKKEAIIICPNSLNINSLNIYYSRLYIFFKIFLSSFMIVLSILLIIGTIIIVVPKLVYGGGYNFFIFYMCLFFASLVLVFINMKKIINNKVQDCIKEYKEQTIFMYDDYLLLKTKKELKKIDYYKFKRWYKSSNYIIIIFKKENNPIIIQRKNMDINNIPLIKKHTRD